jgi:hypothetical protein
MAFALTCSRKSANGPSVSTAATVPTNVLFIIFCLSSVT